MRSMSCSRRLWWHVGVPQPRRGAVIWYLLSSFAVISYTSNGTVKLAASGLLPGWTAGKRAG